MALNKYIPKDLLKAYEVYDHRHAAAIVCKEFPHEFADICDALGRFRLSTKDLTSPGGNESQIPKIMSDILRPKGWAESKLEATLEVFEVAGKHRKSVKKLNHGTHKVDYVKGQVAFDLEWNSKDQTFDRDLYAFRAFFEYHAISVGILVTRSTALNKIFHELNITSKYGASTTHWDKLIPRIEAGRGGGCPILVFGITSEQIMDL